MAQGHKNGHKFVKFSGGYLIQCFKEITLNDGWKNEEAGNAAVIYL